MPRKTAAEKQKLWDRARTVLDEHGSYALKSRLAIIEAHGLHLPKPIYKRGKESEKYVAKISDNGCTAVRYSVPKRFGLWKKSEREEYFDAKICLLRKKGGIPIYWGFDLQSLYAFVDGVLAAGGDLQKLPRVEVPEPGKAVERT